MIKPKISIITVCFNAADTIEDTIKSVINQSYPNLEYIIIDGGSYDNTLNIIEKYKNKIGLVISEKDNGISDAFNKGISNATGELIGLINADDLLTPDSLNMLAKSYSPDIDVYRGNTIMWNSNTNFKCIDIPTMKFPIIPFKLHICHQSTFITKRAYSNYGGYNINFKYMMDIDILIRFYKNNLKFKYINNELSVFRLGGISQVSEKIKSIERRELILINGGNRFHVFVFRMYIRFRQLAKKIINIIGEDTRFLFIGKKYNINNESSSN